MDKREPFSILLMCLCVSRVSSYCFSSFFPLFSNINHIMAVAK
jgi:hypothetical protein